MSASESHLKKPDVEQAKGLRFLRPLQLQLCKLRTSESKKGQAHVGILGESAGP